MVRDIGGETPEKLQIRASYFMSNLNHVAGLSGSWRNLEDYYFNFRTICNGSRVKVGSFTLLP